MHEWIPITRVFGQYVNEPSETDVRRALEDLFRLLTETIRTLGWNAELKAVRCTAFPFTLADMPSIKNILTLIWQQS